MDDIAVYVNEVAAGLAGEMDNKIILRRVTEDYQKVLLANGALFYLLQWEIPAEQVVEFIKEVVVHVTSCINAWRGCQTHIEAILANPNLHLLITGGKGKVVKASGGWLKVE